MSTEPDDAFAVAYTRYEWTLNDAHRRIEALERENAELRIKNYRLTRDLALAPVRARAGEGTQQSSSSRAPLPSSQEGGAPASPDTATKSEGHPS